VSAPTLIPQLADPAVAGAALEAHLGQILRGRAPAEVGWELQQPAGQAPTLYVPMRAFTVPANTRSYGFNPTAADIVRYSQMPDGDDYLLRLYFSHYPNSPASATFVNPESRRYDPITDTKWLPLISGTNEVSVHANYNDGVHPVGQLVCCSATLEFYEVNHSVEPKHQWVPGSSFATLLNTLDRYLRPSFYVGRQG
jgi:hypothetical protein